MINHIQLKQLTHMEEVRLLDQEFARRYPWYRQRNYYETCLQENETGERLTLMAYDKGVLAGCCHLLYRSTYPYFREHDIPEINDLNVFPEHQRKGIASRLFDEFERIASQKYSQIGLGVGLYSDYGKAQRMYGKRGYVMDGNGLMYKNVPVKPGSQVSVDDDLLMYLVKELHIKA
ncbi:GNAT family N-acetyltransferase [Marinicrinis lubricantis]|uniref:GNAT family N-acetyltransferase n=1 Tax=Marinicrinis lubricantis TaxID=2086470 RepID=A0ABW1IRY2_9BACL